MTHEDLDTFTVTDWDGDPFNRGAERVRVMCEKCGSAVGKMFPTGDGAEWLNAYKQPGDVQDGTVHNVRGHRLHGRNYPSHSAFCVECHDWITIPMADLYAAYDKAAASGDTVRLVR